MNLECLDGKPIVCRDEDHLRHRGGADLPHHIEPVHLRHLHIEKDHVGPLTEYERHRLVTVSRFEDGDCIGLALEQRPQARARQRLVVHDQGAQPGSLLGGFHRCAPSIDRASSAVESRRRYGTITSTAAPVSVHSIRSSPSAPCNCFSRALRFDKPRPRPACEPARAPPPVSRTVTCSRLPTRDARTSMEPPATWQLIPCRTAFSAIGCSPMCGTAASSTSGSASMRTTRRSEKRICSMDR